MTSFIGRITAVLSALLLVGALVGCSAATSSTASPVLEEGKSITSPKDDFTAEEKDGKAFVYPIIKNKDGTILWEDVERYLMAAHPVGVAWQKEADILRLLSTDLGNANVARIQGGAWVEDSGAPLPADIDRIAKGDRN